MVKKEKGSKTWEKIKAEEAKNLSCGKHCEKYEEELKEKARKLSIQEGSSYSFMDGFGLRNISPYAIAIGANNFQIGLLSSIPTILGNFLQLFSYKYMEKFSRKKLVTWGVFIQALMWLFIIIPGILYFKFNNDGSLPANILIVVYTLLVVSGAFTGPIWSSWMKDIVPSEKSGSYFGKRNRITGALALFAAIIGSFTLDYFKHTEIFWGFVLLFLLSFVARSISAWLFTKKYEPQFKSDRKYYFSFFQFVKKMVYNNFGRFVIFVSLITFATAISGPFFAVYVLKDLGFNSIPFGYFYYFLVQGLSSSVASILSMQFWGKLGDKYGTIKIMKFNGWFVSLIPIMWIGSIFFIHNFFILLFYLIVVELFSGFIWAGFNLSVGNFIYDSTTRQRMPLCVAYFNMINGTGAFLGATIGGVLASFNIGFWILSPLLVVFLISGILRISFYLLMKKNIREVKEVKDDFNFKKELKKSVRESFSSLSKVEFFEFLRLKRMRPREIG